METRANYALIGAFVIMAVLAVAGFALWLGQAQFRQDFKAYDIVFEGPVSLEEGSAVRYIGIKVGEVSTVRIDRADSSKVRARIRIDAETPVKTDSTASIQLAGITGTTFVQISAGSHTAQALESRPGEPVPVIRSERTSLDLIVSSGQEVIGRANQTIERVNKVLSDENIVALSETIQNLKTVSGRLAAEDGLLTQAEVALKDVSDASEAFETASREFGDFAKTADLRVNRFGDEMSGLIKDIGEVSTSAKETVDESTLAVRSAREIIEGPARGVMEDAQLASQDLRMLIARIDRVARDLESNPQKFVVGEPAPYEE